MTPVRQAQCMLAPFALAFLAVSGYTLQGRHSFMQHAVQVPATIVGYKQIPGRHTRSYTYAPVFTYQTLSGVQRSAVSDVASNPPAYRLRQEVTVLYDSSSPQQAHIAKFSELWALPIIFGAVGLLLCGVTLGLFLVR